MNFREFESKIRDLSFFNLNDIRKIDPGFHRQQLNYWRKQGNIQSLVGGYYTLAKNKLNEPLLYMLANKLYEPSYVSLESALAYYQVIPESVLGVTCVSSRKTTQFESEYGLFRYRTIQPRYLFGYNFVESDVNVKYKIAKLEKAILDYLYLHSEIVSLEDFDMLRWNVDQLESIRESKLFSNYLQYFGKTALRNRVNILLEYIHA